MIGAAGRTPHPPTPRLAGCFGAWSFFEGIGALSEVPREVVTVSPSCGPSSISFTAKLPFVEVLSLALFRPLRIVSQSKLRPRVWRHAHHYIGPVRCRC